MIDKKLVYRYAGQFSKKTKTTAKGTFVAEHFSKKFSPHKKRHEEIKHTSFDRTGHSKEAIEIT